MRICVFGSRTFIDYRRLCDKLNPYLASWLHPHELVSGRCPEGADYLGEVWAKYHGIRVKPFPANWAKFGRPAGPRRNTEMARYLAEQPFSVAIGFWNGESHGTSDMIQKVVATKRVELHVYYF